LEEREIQPEELVVSLAPPVLDRCRRLACSCVGDSLVHVGQSLDEFGALGLGSLDILGRDLAISDMSAGLDTDSWFNCSIVDLVQMRAMFNEGEKG
jgi:hypothetical protein